MVADKLAVATEWRLTLIESFGWPKFPLATDFNQLEFCTIAVT